MKSLLIACIRFYQLAVSPYIRPRCRFVPTCSGYMAQAIEERGALRGLRAGLRRLSRCHPWGGSGLDPTIS